MRRHAASVESDLASQYEDRILETLKKVGAHVDSAVGAFTNLSHLGDRATNLQVRHVPLYQGSQEVFVEWRLSGCTRARVCLVY